SHVFKQAAATSLPGITVVEFEDGQKSKFHNYWLRDHCKCEKCVHPVTYQRIIDPLEFEVDISPSKSTVSDGSLVVEWDNGAHKSVFPLAWLKKHSYDQKFTSTQQPKLKLWGSELENKIPSVPYDKVMNTDEGLFEWLQNISIYGLCAVSGVPPNGNVLFLFDSFFYYLYTCDTRKVLERIGPIRETHYGGFWEFTSGFEHGDLAYSTVNLPAHTDNTYYTDPAGLQLFHLLAMKGKGGEQVYVDGFNVAKQLKDLYPEAYETLSNLGTWANQAGDNEVFLRPSPGPYSVLNHDKAGNLFQVRYNNEDRSIINNLSFEEVPKYYSAIRKWMKLVRDPKNELIVPLKPGYLIALDNWRVMHARKEYSGSRTLSGGYIDRDYWTSKLRVLDGRVRGVDSRNEIL
ncbi:hypothetical protein BB560_005530, partial [Smittium megazygosporum]